MTQDKAPDWATIKGYFTEHDHNCMLGQGLDLWDCSVVNDNINSQEIQNQVDSGAMPQGGPEWTQEMKDNFSAWRKSANPCP